MSRASFDKKKRGAGDLKNFGDKLHQWPKGVSGNPAGKPPKEQCIPEQTRLIGGRKIPPEMIRKFQREFPGENFDGMTYLQAIIFRNMRKAIDGDGDARDFLAERSEGKVTDNINLTSKNDSKVETTDLTKLSAEQISALRSIVRATKKSIEHGL